MMEVRTSAPSNSNKYYIYRGNGGYNDCIRINKTTGSCLPNCVGYAWGASAEMMGWSKKGQCKLSTGNAENWWDHADPYYRSQKPHIGDIICWRKGLAHNASDGAGHVGIVIKIYADASILVAQSAYGGKRWYTTKIAAPYNVGSFKFQGFISLEKPTEWEPGDYIVLNAKYLRTSPCVDKNNKILYSKLSANAKKKCTKDSKGYAKYKKKAEINIKEFTTDKKGNVWGRTNTLWLCVQDATGKQVKKK